MLSQRWEGYSILELVEILWFALVRKALRGLATLDDLAVITAIEGEEPTRIRLAA